MLKLKKKVKIKFVEKKLFILVLLVIFVVQTIFKGLVTNVLYVMTLIFVKDAKTEDNMIIQ